MVVNSLESDFFLKLYSEVSDGVLIGQQGASVSLSANGLTLLVGAPVDDFGSGVSFLYSKSRFVDSYKSPAILLPTVLKEPRHFGTSVSLSSNGQTCLIGAPKFGKNVFETGTAFIYTMVNEAWTETAQLTGRGSVGNSNQGQTVSLSGDGMVALVGGPNDNDGQGAVWFFTKIGNKWKQVGSKVFLAGTSAFGQSMSLNFDGSKAIIGSEGFAYLFTFEKTKWILETAFGDGNDLSFGNSVGISKDGVTVLVGAPESLSNDGSISIYHFDEIWSQTQLLNFEPSGFHREIFYFLGETLAISADGSTVIASIRKSLVYDKDILVSELNVIGYFRNEYGDYIQMDEILDPSNTLPASSTASYSLALDETGRVAVVGSKSDDEFMGGVWIFTRGDDFA